MTARTCRRWGFLAAAVLVLGVARGGSPAWADSTAAVVRWNRVAREALQFEFLQSSPGRASRLFAMLHLTLFDVLNAAQPRYAGYLDAPVGPRRDFDPQAALAAAGCTVLSAILPAQRERFEAARDADLARLADSGGKTAGFSLGQWQAQRMLALRTGDGSAAPAVYTQSPLLGAWRPTPPGFATPVTPQWGGVRPFVLPRLEGFLIPPPPALGSAEYAAAYAEVRASGALDSTTRTADEAEAGLFWAYDRPGMGSPVVLYNSMLEQLLPALGLDALDTARLFALVNAAMADSVILCWEAKYRYNLWRPITALREGETDGNPLTPGEPLWRPLGAPGGGIFADFTPPHPSYPAGHSSLGGACFRVLERLYGPAPFAFTLTSGERPGLARSYLSFAQAERENGRSRIWLGVHWSFDDTAGRDSGEQIAGYVVEHALTPRRNAAAGWECY